MGSDAPHRKAISATEDDNLHDEGTHADSAPATPLRDDPPDGPELSQDDRPLHRRTPLDTAAPDAAADHEAALNATAVLTHSSTISSAPAFYASGLGCCQQPPSPTGINSWPAGQIPMHRVVAPLWQRVRTRISSISLWHDQAQAGPHVGSQACPTLSARATAQARQSRILPARPILLRILPVRPILLPPCWVLPT